MDAILSSLDAALDAEQKAFVDASLAALREKGAAHLPVLFPQLARLIGREPLAGSRVKEGDVVIDASAWRRCDAVGLALFRTADPSDEQIVDLYLHGDIEERAILLRCLACSPVTSATITLFGEVQRTNTVHHFEAGALDSNLAVRALREGGDDQGLTRRDYHRLVLKAAFLDLPIWRMFEALDETDAKLAGMLQGYATEREAGGRSVWVDTNRFLGRAPVPGSVARILGALEHGDDATRLAAAEGLLALNRPDLSSYAADRLERERREPVKAILERIAASAL